MQEPLRRLVGIRYWILSIVETALIAACYVAAIFILRPIDASLYLEYEGGALRVAVVALTFLVTTYLFDFYKLQTRSRLVIALQLCQLLGIILLVQAVFGFLELDFGLPQDIVLLASLLMLFVFVTWRLFFRQAFWNAFGAQRVVFVGFNSAVAELADAYATNSAFGMSVAGYIMASEEVEVPGRVLGDFSRIAEIVADVRPDRLIIGDIEGCGKDLLRTLFSFKSSGLNVETAAQVYETAFSRIYGRGLEPYALIFRDELSAKQGSVALQSIYTNIIALAVIILALPVILLIAAGLKISRRGPVLVKQPCIGLHGIPFNLYRFQCSASMKDGFSRFVARYKLDALPQVFNIVRGEMGLIGPRAERIEFDAVLTELIPFYRQRQYVRPGVIGWSQLHCDTLPYEDTLARIEYDLYYIKHISLVLDGYVLITALKWALADHPAVVPQPTDYQAEARVSK